MSCRFLDSNKVCSCKVGTHGKPVICTNPEECTLKQTESELKKSLHKSWARFTSLPVDKQNLYKSIYYGGRYPWEVYNDNNNR